VCSRRRDWFRILRDLKAVGLSYGAVARKVGRDPSTVQGWAEGAEPRESDARVVLALYAKHRPADYLRHQKEFEIRVEMVNVTEIAESPHPSFVAKGAR
jgi:hypothetical protein